MTASDASTAKMPSLPVATRRPYRQATLNEVETYHQGLLDQVAKVKLTLEKHY